MLFRDVINLIGEVPGAHGVFDAVTETSRQVYCTVRTVGMSEAYAAMSYGLHPELVFLLSEYTDYQGEKIAEYAGKRYRIVRTYRANQGIELTCEEVTVDR